VASSLALSLGLLADCKKGSARPVSDPSVIHSSIYAQIHSEIYTVENVRRAADPFCALRVRVAVDGKSAWPVPELGRTVVYV